MELPFYNDGLRFKCTRCSACCRIDPGYVFLSLDDLRDIADFFNVSKRDVFKQHCREVDISGFKRISLREKSNYDCIFWKKAGCTIYEARPLQCKSFPFWSSNLVSKQTWENMSCPGIGVGPVHSREMIDDWLARRERNWLLVDKQKVISN